ncbi:hypothetical protein ACVWZ4_002688 [Bradyrhizobium sp. USDA 4472]
MAGACLDARRHPRARGFRAAAGSPGGHGRRLSQTRLDWPNNRYLLISLGGQYDEHPNNTVMKGLGGWQCRYDLQTGKFDVPGIFAKDNADALAWEVKRE